MEQYASSIAFSKTEQTAMYSAIRAGFRPNFPENPSKRDIEKVIKAYNKFKKEHNILNFKEELARQYENRNDYRVTMAMEQARRDNRLQNNNSQYRPSEALRRFQQNGPQMKEDPEIELATRQMEQYAPGIALNKTEQTAMQDAIWAGFRPNFPENPTKEDIEKVIEAYNKFKKEHNILNFSEALARQRENQPQLSPEVEQRLNQTRELVNEGNSPEIMNGLYGLDRLQSPAQIAMNLGALELMPTDAEIFREPEFRDISTMLNNITVAHPSLGNVGVRVSQEHPDNDISLFRQRVRLDTGMYLANTSQNGIKPEEFRQEYANRLRSEVVSLVVADQAIRNGNSNRPATQEEASRIIDGIVAGNRREISQSAFIGWQAQRETQQNNAVETMAQKPGYRRVAQLYLNRIRNIDQKLTKKYGKTYSAAKNLLKSFGWGAAYRVAGVMAGPAGIAAVATASFVKSSYQLYKDYKRNKAQSKDGKYNFFKYLKENKLRVAGTFLSGLSAMSGLSGVLDIANGATAAFNAVRPAVGYMMSAAGALHQASEAYRSTEGSRFRRVLAAGRAFAASAASFAVGVEAGRLGAEFATETYDNYVSQQPDIQPSFDNNIQYNQQDNTLQNVQQEVEQPAPQAEPQEQTVEQPTAPQAEPQEQTVEQPTAPQAEPQEQTVEQPTAPQAEPQEQEQPTQEPQTNDNQLHYEIKPDSIEINVPDSAISQEQVDALVPEWVSEENRGAAQALAGAMLRNDVVYNDLQDRIENGYTPTRSEEMFMQLHQDKMEQLGFTRDEDGNMVLDNRHNQVENQQEPQQQEQQRQSEENHQEPQQQEQQRQSEENHQEPQQQEQPDVHPLRNGNVNISYEISENRVAVQGNVHISQADIDKISPYHTQSEFTGDNGFQSNRYQATMRMEAADCRNFLVNDEIYQDLQNRANAGETLSDAENRFMNRHEQALENRGLIRDENGQLTRAQTFQEWVNNDRQYSTDTPRAEEIAQNISRQQEQAQQPEPQQPQAESGGNEDMRVVNGTFKYEIAQDGTVHTISGVEKPVSSNAWTQIYDNEADANRNADEISAEERSCQRIVQNDMIYQDIQHRMENGYTPSDGERTFMQGHEQALADRNIVRDDNGNLTLEKYTNQQETPEPQKEAAPVEKQTESKGQEAETSSNSSGENSESKDKINSLRGIANDGASSKADGNTDQQQEQSKEQPSADKGAKQEEKSDSSKDKIKNLRGIGNEKHSSRKSDSETRPVTKMNPAISRGASRN